MRKVILMFFASAFLFSCNNNKNDEVKVGEYVYFDRYKCLHIKRNCIKLNFTDTENEEPRYMVYRVEVKKLGSIGTTCSSCVTDEDYKELERIINK